METKTRENPMETKTGENPMETMEKRSEATENQKKAPLKKMKADLQDEPMEKTHIETMERQSEATENQKKAPLNKIKADLQDEPMEDTHEDSGIAQTFFGKVKTYKANVKTSIISRSEWTEKWHKNAANWPLKCLSRVHRFEQAVGGIMDIQDRTIGHGYNLARMAINGMDNIANEILTRTEKRFVA